MYSYMHSNRSSVIRHVDDGTSGLNTLCVSMQLSRTRVPVTHAGRCHCSHPFILSAVQTEVWGGSAPRANRR